MEKVLVELKGDLLLDSVDDARSIYEFMKSKCNTKYFVFQCHVNFDYVDNPDLE